MGAKKKIIIIICLLLIASCFLFFVWAWSGIYIPKNPSSAKTEVFTVKKGEGAKEISINLKNQNLIKYKSLFRIYALLKGRVGILQAGEYELSSSMTIPEIIKKLSSGDVIKRNITIIEGWNAREIAAYLEGKGVCLYSEFMDLISEDFSSQFDFLKDKPKEMNLEGYLFPDTYEISYSGGARELIKKSLQNFNTKLTKELRQEIISQKKTIFEIITMASLLEEEAKTLEDKKIISGILWKRLKIGMPLQVDATISYITGRKDVIISVVDIKIDSSYNTYKYKGLPPGPISNPGIESIKAAIYPQDSSYLYYLSTPEGKIIFSKTLEEHNIAKAKYLK